MSDPLEELHAAIRSAAEALRDGAPDRVAPTLERPPKPELGDYSTNAAMLLAPARGQPAAGDRRAPPRGARRPPRAERRADRGRRPRLRERLPRRPLAPGEPGRLLDAGDDFGGGSPERPERVLVEFVSANPTGPLTVASGRGAAYGDSLARLLGAGGARRRAGVPPQRRRRPGAAGSRSRSPRGCRGASRPRTATRGEYVAELASELAAAGADPADLDELARRGTAAMRERIEATPGPLRRPLRHLVLGAVAARCGQGRGGDRGAAGARPRVRQRGRRLAADHGVRRRQGPGPDPLRRRAHLLRRRHRLPPRQARARRGAPDRSGRRRPPRLRPPDAGRRSRRWATTRPATRRRSSSSSTWSRAASGRGCRSGRASSPRSTS